MDTEYIIDVTYVDRSYYANHEPEIKKANYTYKSFEAAKESFDGYVNDRRYVKVSLVRKNYHLLETVNKEPDFLNSLDKMAELIQ